MKLDIPLHYGQRKVIDSPNRYRVLVCGRRWGKSSLVLWEMVIRSLQYPGDVRKELMPATVLGAMPTMNQAKQVLWQPLVTLVQTYFPSQVQKINHSDSTIWFKNGKPPIKIRGANDANGDRLRGSRLYFVALDEYQDWKPEIFNNVIEPAMKDTKGSRAIFTGTPKGRLNHFYSIANKAIKDSTYTYFNMPTWVNPTIPREEVELSRNTLPDRVFRQEYEASFEDFPGKIYYELDSTNRYEGNFDTSVLDYVVMGVDWGDRCPALSVVGRDKLGQWYWLEGWSPGNERESPPITQPVLQANMLRLARKWKVNASYADPSRPSEILATRQLGINNSIPGLRKCVEGYNKIQEGISQVHTLISTKELKFVPGLADRVPDSVDGNLAYMLAEAYHRVIDKNGNITDEPADGYFSHLNDALRYSLASKVA